MVMRCPGCSTVVIETMSQCPVCQRELNGAPAQRNPTQQPHHPKVPSYSTSEHSVSTPPPSPTPPPRAPIDINPATILASSLRSTSSGGVDAPYAPTSTGSSGGGFSGGGVDVGSGSSPSDPAGGRSSRHLLMFAAGFLSVVALAASTFLVINGAKPANALEVTLISLEDRGPAPFTDSVTAVEIKTARNFARSSSTEPTTTTRPSNSSGRLQLVSTPGDTAGIYGISATTPVCDKARLKELITKDQDTANAWAATTNIEGGAIGSTIDSYAPVLLGRDTAVTNHAYGSDGVYGFQSILEAGTAVLVDAFGTPRVQCSCGNPLAEAQLGDRNVNLSGDRWDGFNPDDITIHPPSKEQQSAIDGKDIETGEQTVTPVGDNISLDGYLVSTDEGVSVVSYDGATTTQVIDHPVARVFDDGMGGLIYQERRSTGDTSWGLERNLANDRPASVDEAAIWHLPAGASEATRIVEAPDDLSSWPVLEGAGPLGGEPVIVHMTVPAHSDTSSPVPRVTLDAAALESGKRTTLDDSVSYGGFVYQTVIGGDLMAVALERGDGHPGEWHFYNQHLEKTTPAVYSNWPHELTFGLDALTLSGTSVTAITTEGDGPVLKTAAGDPNATMKSVAIDLPLGADTHCRVIDSNDSIALLSCESTLYQVDLKSGDAKEAPVAARSTERGTLRYLRAPIIRPANDSDGQNASVTTTSPASSTTLAPTTTLPRQAPTWDEIKNAQIPGACQHDPTTLVDGKDVTLGEGMAVFELNQTELVSGLTSDSGPLTVATFYCNPGGNAVWPEGIAAFSAGGIYYDMIFPDGHETLYEASSIWTAIGTEGPGRSGAAGLTINGDHVFFETQGCREGTGIGIGCEGIPVTVAVSASGGSLHIDSVTKR